MGIFIKSVIHGGAAFKVGKNDLSPSVGRYPEVQLLGLRSGWRRRVKGRPLGLPAAFRKVCVDTSGQQGSLLLLEVVNFIS